MVDTNIRPSGNSELTVGVTVDGSLCVCVYDRAFTLRQLGQTPAALTP